jgi:hypothetical protein
MNTSSLLPYGWADFDQQIVDSMSAGPEGAIDIDMSSGMRCPLLGHDSWLSWAEGQAGEGRKARHGTVWAGDPPLRFHSSPTYVLQRPIDNFIAGRALIGEALDGHWGKAETGRLGHENSEDALTWNVFRSLQEAGELPAVIRELTGIDAAGEPALYLWGRQVELCGTSAWPALADARQAIEPCGGQQLAPDCCLHLPGQAWIFVEAKFGSPTATKKLEDARNAWAERYDKSCPGVFRKDVIQTTPPDQFPEQLLRNVALALQVRQAAEQVIVVALVREVDVSCVDVVAHRCLNDGLEVKVRVSTWEQVYSALREWSALDLLRRYLERKSYRLQPAFSIPQQNSRVVPQP